MLLGRRWEEGMEEGGTEERGEGGAVTQINDQHVPSPRRQRQYKPKVVQSCPFRTQCAGSLLFAVSQAGADQE